MATVTKERLSKEKSKVKEQRHGLMAPISQDILWMAKNTAMEFLRQHMATVTKESLLTGIGKVKEPRHGSMARNTQDNTFMAKSMVMEF